MGLDTYIPPARTESNESCAYIHTPAAYMYGSTHWHTYAENKRNAEVSEASACCEKGPLLPTIAVTWDRGHS